MRTRRITRLLLICLLVSALTACLPGDTELIAGVFDEWARAKGLNPKNEKGQIDPVDALIAGYNIGRRALTGSTGDKDADAALGVLEVVYPITQLDRQTDQAIDKGDPSKIQAAIKDRPDDYTRTRWPWSSYPKGTKARLTAPTWRRIRPGLGLTPSRPWTAAIRRSHVTTCRFWTGQSKARPRTAPPRKGRLCSGSAIARTPSSSKVRPVLATTSSEPRTCSRLTAAPTRGRLSSIAGPRVRGATSRSQGRIDA
jgi:hypothetical protein